MNAARRSFEAGIEAAPDYPPVYEALARLEWGEGNEARAEEVARGGGWCRRRWGRGGRRRMRRRPPPRPGGR